MLAWLFFLKYKFKDFVRRDIFREIIMLENIWLILDVSMEKYFYLFNRNIFISSLSNTSEPNYAVECLLQSYYIDC